MAIKTLRVFQEFTSAGYVPMPVAGNIDYGVTIAGTFPGTTPTTFQTDDPDIDVTLTATTDYYVWIRSHGTDWNPMYTRNVRVYPDSPLVNNVVMGIIIANLDNTVPYTSATENVNLGEFGLTAGYLGLDLTPTATPTLAGTMSWNDADGTANLILKGGNVTLQVGQEQVTRIVNKTGANLLEANYQAVRVSGAQGNRLKVDLAQANIDANSAETLGLVTETINNNQEGFITTSGLVRNIDTTGTLQGETWADGDMLYLSGTTAGRITNIKPQAPTHTVIMGYVVRAHQTQGQIYVKVDNGYELDELHNVKITSVANKNTLVYDSATSVWKNRNIFGTQGYVPYYDDTLLMKNSPIFTDGTQVIIGDDEEFSVGNKLSVVGNIAVHKDYGYHSGLYQILFRQDATGEFRIGTNAANDYTTFYANGTERVRISPSGFLGVGLTNPTSILHVKGTTAYTNAIIDNNSASGGGYYSAYQNGAEKAIFGVSGAWLLDNSSDAALIAKGVGQGIQFYTNGSTSEKMGINSDGNVFVGQTPTYVAGATQLVVRGKTGAGFVGVNHYDMSIKGGMNTFNYVFQVGTSTFHSMAFLVEDIERGRVNSSGRLLWGTTTDNTTDLVQINGSLIATSIKKSGGTSSQFLKADGSVDSTTYGTGTVTSVAMSVPTGLSINGSPITTSGTLALSLSAGYSIPTTSSQGTWDTAYNRSLTSIGVSGTTTKTLTLTKQDGTTLTASWSDINTDAVTSVFGRTGAIVATGGDYTTAQVTESGNLYYLDSRARASISGGTGISYNSTTGVITNTITQYTDALARASLSFVAGSGAYNSTTGVITIPTNNNQITNGAGYISGITSGMVTTALGYTPVTNARQLTINGTTYDLSADRSWTISGTIGGLTSGFIPKATSASTLGNSLIYDDGSGVGIGTTSPVQKLEVVGNIKTGSDNFTNVNGGWFFNGNGSYANGIFAYNTSNNLRLVAPTQIEFTIGFSEIMRLTAGGNFLVGTTTDSGYKLDINGRGRFSSTSYTNLYVDGTNSTGWGNNIAFRSQGTDFAYVGSLGSLLGNTTKDLTMWATAGNGFRVYTNGNNLRLNIDSSGAATFSNNLFVNGYYLNRTNSGGYFTGVSDNFGFTYDGSAANISNASATPIIFYTSGAERMRLTSAGNLLVGTTTDAGYKLDVNGTGRFSSSVTATNAIFNQGNILLDYFISSTVYSEIRARYQGQNNCQSAIRFYNPQNGYSGDMRFYTQPNINLAALEERMRITDAGNVGIGTSSPSAKIHAYGGASGNTLPTNAQGIFEFNSNGGIAVSVPTGNAGGIYFPYSTSAYYAGIDRYLTDLRFLSGDAVRLTIASTGAATFSSTVTAGGRYIVSVSSSAGISDISYGSYSGGAFINTPSATIGYLAAAGTQALAWDSNNVIFYTNVGNERMRIVQSGNVGIGTTSPLALLNVVASGTKSTIAIGNTAASTYSQVLMYGGSGKYNWSLGAQYNVNNGFEITPSTAVDGTTFTTPVFQITNSGAATFSSSVTASGAIYQQYLSATKSATYLDASRYTIQTVANYDIAFEPATVERMRITTAGNVGIGTTSPTGKLEIRGNRSATKDLLLNLSKFDYGASNFYQNYSNTFFTNGKSLEIEVEALPMFQLAVNNAGTQGRVIFPNGNVGIGTASPTVKLEVEAATTGYAAIIRNTTAGGDYLKMIGDSGNTVFEFGSGGTGGDGFLNIYSDNTQKVSINADGTSYFNGGNVGIGTTSPGANLVVQNSSGTSIPSLGASGGHFQLQNGTYGLLAGVNGAGNAWMQVQRTDSTATAYNLLLQPNGGNVGIGTTSPAYKLEIYDAAGASMVVGAATGKGYFYADDAGATVGTLSAIPLRFATSATERMRITSGGNLLVGTTTDSGYKLDVNAGNLRVKGSTNEQLVLDYTTASGGFTWQSFRINGTNKYRIFGHTDNSFALYSDTASAQVLTFASTGAATFSSSVTATSFIKTGGTSSQYLMADGSVTTSSGSVGGSGTTNYISKWNGTTSLANSQIFDNGTQVTIGSNVAMYKFAVNPVSNSYFGIGYTGTNSIFVNAVDSGFTSIPIVNNALSHTWLIGFGTAMTLTSSLDLLIGTSTGVSGGGKLQVNGDVNINGNFKINGTVIGGGGGSGITGSGTTNMIAKWTGGTSLGDSALYDNGAYSMGIGTTSIAFPTDRKGLVIRPNGANSGEILLQNSGNTNGSTDGFAIANINGDGVALYNRINAHIRFGTNNTERLRITEDGNLGFGTTSQFGGGVKVIGISNCTSIPNTTPSGGGILFVQNGALKYMGSNGTYTTIANA